MEVFTQSARQTQKLGEKLAADLISGKSTPRVLCLYGDLGSGKTTFIQGLARGLGIGKRVLSPTFVIVRQYVIGDTQDVKHKSHFYHIDLYRVENERDVGSLGLSEIWSDPENVVAIEWAEKIEKILPKRRIDIHFAYVSKNRRRITISGS